MPPRLAHKKSRQGCIRCKSRKVKCTEERPSCAACFRHSLPCHYPQKKDPHSASAHAHKSLEAPSIKASSVVGPASPYSLEDDIDALDSEHFQRRLLELRLLHHYVTVVARTMPASKGDAHSSTSADIRELYIVDTVQMAFEYPFLLNTIFAISALHKTQPQPRIIPEPARAPTDAVIGGLEAEDQVSVAGVSSNSIDSHVRTFTDTDHKSIEVTEYARAHQIYLNMAIRQQREALMELGQKNADAVCINSVLLSMIALKILPTELKQKYEPPVQWLSMAHAISTVVQASQPFLTANTAMARIISYNDPNFRDREAIFTFSHTKPFQAILDHPENVHTTEEENVTYNLAVAYVGGIHRAIQEHDPHRQVARRIMSIGPMLSSQFISLVEERRPKALVIIAYAMAMSKYVDDYWFFRGTAEHEVYGTQSILPGDWQWAMQWPVEMLKTLAEPEYRNPDA